MKTHDFKQVVIVGRKKEAGLKQVILRVAEILKELSIEFWIEKHTTEIHDIHNDSIYEYENPEAVGLMIVIGGDGSMLHAAQHAIDNQIPILGINYGRIGFLTESIDLKSQLLQSILTGHYTMESRMTLDVWLESHHGEQQVGRCINEISLSRPIKHQMLEVELSLDDQFICNYHGDGLIVATPTGSTAYALSAGGPIISPGVNSCCIVPVCPHNLSSRPLIINADTQVSLAIGSFHGENAHIVLDALSPIPCQKDTRVHIKRSNKQLKLIHPINYSFYETLKTKLAWENKVYARNH